MNHPVAELIFPEAAMLTEHTAKACYHLSAVNRWWWAVLSTKRNSLRRKDRHECAWTKIYLRNAVTTIVKDEQGSRWGMQRRATGAYMVGNGFPVQESMIALVTHLGRANDPESRFQALVGWHLTDLRRNLRAHHKGDGIGRISKLTYTANWLAPYHAFAAQVDCLDKGPKLKPHQVPTPLIPRLSAAMAAIEETWEDIRTLAAAISLCCIIRDWVLADVSWGHLARNTSKRQIHILTAAASSHAECCYGCRYKQGRSWYARYEEARRDYARDYHPRIRTSLMKHPVELCTDCKHPILSPAVHVHPEPTRMDANPDPTERRLIAINCRCQAPMAQLSAKDIKGRLKNARHQRRSPWDAIGCPGRHKGGSHARKRWHEHRIELAKDHFGTQQNTSKADALMRHGLWTAGQWLQIHQGGRPLRIKIQRSIWITTELINDSEESTYWHKGQLPAGFQQILWRQIGLVRAIPLTWIPSNRGERFGDPDLGIDSYRWMNPSANHKLIMTKVREDGVCQAISHSSAEQWEAGEKRQLTIYERKRQARLSRQSHPGQNEYESTS